MHVGLDWAYRSAQWCALAPGGELAGEGRVAADRDGLARLVLELGDEVTACLEMTSGAAWGRDELVACGRQVEVADARKVKACLEMMSGAAWVRDELVECGRQVEGRRRAQGEDGRTAGGEDGQGRRASARRTLPPPAGAGVVASLAR